MVSRSSPSFSSAQASAKGTSQTSSSVSVIRLSVQQHMAAEAS